MTGAVATQANSTAGGTSPDSWIASWASPSLASQEDVSSRPARSRSSRASPAKTLLASRARVQVSWARESDESISFAWANSSSTWMGRPHAGHAVSRSGDSAANSSVALRATILWSRSASFSLWKASSASSSFANDACIGRYVVRRMCPEVRGVPPPLSVGEMTLKLYTALNYSQNRVHDLRRALNGA